MDGSLNVYDMTQSFLKGVLCYDIYGDPKGKHKNVHVMCKYICNRIA
jgi:hypothetical protein